MQFDELQQRYGLYIAEMVRQTLSSEELTVVHLDQLEDYLQQRTRSIYQDYHARLQDDAANDNQLNELRLRWQEAEDILNLVEAAESVAEATSLKRTVS
jgi:hypothetical protein